MSIYSLPEDEIWFPTPDLFSDDIVAVGGDLSPERLIAAYSQGIFPWYNDPGEMVWWCPQTRCILLLNDLKISHSMRNVINKRTYRVTMDTAFGQILDGCREGMRVGQTWLIDEMVEAYTRLFNLGIAHSVEVWEEDNLVGGLYGLSMGKVFFGESMFSRKANTSKLAFISLAQFIQSKGWKMLDCQVVTDHLVSLGSSGLPRNLYLDMLKEELNHETQLGKWTDEFQLFHASSGNR